MKKKIVLGLAAAGTAVAMIPLFAAFEAHVINVTAKIENALKVSAYEIAFGTVFPQEALDKTFDVQLSDSFVETGQNRADNVRYVIRQKPKCVTSSGSHPQVTEDAQGNFECPDGSTMMPLLCPYLSKHEQTLDGQDNETGSGENDSAGLNAFHGLPGPWTPSTTVTYQVAGKLIKSLGDLSDTWNIDLKVPCFEDKCAQDWDEFVLGQNPQANPDAYRADLDDEHEVFGCDLWLEVTEVSQTP